jgi:hypothetical protein
MMDRFRDAHWYIGGGDALSTIIYDAGDLEGDGPDGHGMVCQDAVLYDARLISQAPALLRIVQTLCEYADVGRLVCEGAAVDYAVLDEAIGAARDAIAKIEEV